MRASPHAILYATKLLDARKSSSFIGFLEIIGWALGFRFYNSCLTNFDRIFVFSRRMRHMHLLPMWLEKVKNRQW